VGAASSRDKKPKKNIISRLEAAPTVLQISGIIGMGGLFD
jgi:hypothetical protein